MPNYKLNFTPEHFQKPKEKVKRNYFTKYQADKLESLFLTFPIPTKSLRDSLSKDFGIPSKSIKIWFQNRRAKAKNDINEAVVDVESSEQPSVSTPLVDVFSSDIESFDFNSFRFDISALNSSANILFANNEITSAESSTPFLAQETPISELNLDTLSLYSGNEGIFDVTSPEMNLSSFNCLTPSTFYNNTSLSLDQLMSEPALFPFNTTLFPSDTPYNCFAFESNYQTYSQLLFDAEPTNSFKMDDNILPLLFID